MNETTKNDNEIDLIEDFDDFDRAIIQARVSRPGSTIQDIVDVVGKSYTQVQRRLANPKVKRAIAEQQRDALNILLTTQRDAAMVLYDIVNNPASSDQDKIRAAKEILKGVLSERQETHEQIVIEFINRTVGGDNAD